jgi:ribosomal protein L23
MALFSRTPKKKAEKASAPAADKAAKVSGMKQDLSHVLLSPRITEKATMHTADGVYVFDVATSANKKQIMSAINATYSVKPRMVRIVNIRAKVVRNMRTGKSGVKQGGKKAYVYLKKGETISIN